VKNSEKYKTALTRERAFRNFCSKHSCFNECPVLQIQKNYIPKKGEFGVRLHGLTLM
jgi:hypothetical protein